MVFFGCGDRLSELTNEVTVQPNAAAMETGLLLGLKARVNTAQGVSLGLDRSQKKLLGSMGPRISKNKRFFGGLRLPRARSLG